MITSASIQRCGFYVIIRCSSLLNIRRIDPLTLFDSGREISGATEKRSYYVDNGEVVTSDLVK